MLKLLFSNRLVWYPSDREHGFKKDNVPVFLAFFEDWKRFGFRFAFDLLLMTIGLKKIGKIDAE